MKEFLMEYSIKDILLIIVSLGIGAKAFISFWDWAVARLRKFFNKETKEDKYKENVNEKFNEIQKELKLLIESNEKLRASIEDNQLKVQELIDSDKDDIKAFLTKEHHYFCYQKGWIDDYSLDCIEKRYSHYVNEGGNSFVKDLMMDIRRLPKHAQG